MSAVGVDLGSCTCYVAATRTRGIEVLDNDYSERATPCYLSFTGSRRFCGVSAFNQSVTNVSNTVTGFRNLLGLKFNDPDAQYEMSLHSVARYVRLDDDEIGIKVSYLNKEEIFTPIQLAAMVLGELKEMSYRHLGIYPNIVLSCPVYFNSRQRRALAAAAHVAEVNLVGIMNDNQATTLTYGLYNIFGVPDNNTASKIVMFIDIGYSSTQIFLANFEAGNKISILSCVGSNRFGGRIVDGMVTENFIKEFKTKYKIDVKSRPKAWVKLMNEVSNLKKKVNSGSASLPLNIECFMDDIDVSGKLNRDEIAELCAETVEREVESLIDQAIQQSSIPITNFNEQVVSIEVIGGSTRLTMIRNLIADKFKREISTKINCDEAVARGCTLYCAKLTPTIQIKTFDIHGIVYYDVRAQIYVQDTLLEEIDLFKRGKQSPCTCLVSVEPESNFRVVLQQLVGQNAEYIDVSEWNIRGVAKDSNGNPQKVKLRVRHDQNAYVVVTQAQMFEIVEEAVDATEQAHEIDPETAKQSENDTQSNSKDVKKPPMRSINLAVEQVNSGIFSNEVLSKYNAIEKSILAQIASEKARSDSKNSFEEYIYKFRDRLDGVWRDFVTETDVIKIKDQLSQQEDWLYEEGEHQSAQVYIDRLANLVKISKPIEDRFTQSEQARLLFDEFGSAIIHYQKIVNNYKSGKVDNHKHIPQEKMEEVEKITSGASASLAKAQNMFRAWNRVDAFPIKIQDVYNSMNDYKRKCDVIVNMPVPPPEKPADEKSVDTNGSDSPEFTAPKEKSNNSSEQNKGNSPNNKT